MSHNHEDHGIVDRTWQAAKVGAVCAAPAAMSALGAIGLAALGVAISRAADPSDPTGGNAALTLGAFFGAIPTLVAGYRAAKGAAAGWAGMILDSERVKDIRKLTVGPLGQTLAYGAGGMAAYGAGMAGMGMLSSALDGAGPVMAVIGVPVGLVLGGLAIVGGLTAGVSILQTGLVGIAAQNDVLGIPVKGKLDQWREGRADPKSPPAPSSSKLAT